MRGRKPKLNAERQAKIVAVLANGHFAETACAQAGIACGTFYNWLAKGEKQAKGEYRDFLEAVKKADADFEVIALGKIKAAAEPVADRPGQWQAYAWILERRHPKRWGRKRVEIVGDDGGPVQADIGGVAPVSVKISVNGPNATATPDFGQVVDESGGA